MSKSEKLILRFLEFPKDFTWDELVKMLRHFGFEILKTKKTGGSRRKFFKPGVKSVINLHKPHPGNILKRYQLDLVYEILRKENLL